MVWLTMRDLPSKDNVGVWKGLILPFVLSYKMSTL